MDRRAREVLHQEIGTIYVTPGALAGWRSLSPVLDGITPELTVLKKRTKLRAAIYDLLHRRRAYSRQLIDVGYLSDPVKRRRYFLCVAFGCKVRTIGGRRYPCGCVDACPFCWARIHTYRQFKRVDQLLTGDPYARLRYQHGMDASEVHLVVRCERRTVPRYPGIDVNFLRTQQSQEMGRGVRGQHILGTLQYAVVIPRESDFEVQRRIFAVVKPEFEFTRKFGCHEWADVSQWRAPYTSLREPRELLATAIGEVFEYPAAYFCGESDMAGVAAETVKALQESAEERESRQHMLRVTGVFSNHAKAFAWRDHLRNKVLRERGGTYLSRYELPFLPKEPISANEQK